MVGFHESVFRFSPKFYTVAVSYGIKRIAREPVLAPILERSSDPAYAAVSDDDIFGKPGRDAVGRAVAYPESVVDDIVRSM